MTYQDLPLLNACLNASTAVLLLAGWIQIKRGNKEAHKKIMVTAFCVSTVFLASYLLHKFHRWTETLSDAGLGPNPLFFHLNSPHRPRGSQSSVHFGGGLVCGYGSV